MSNLNKLRQVYCESVDRTSLCHVYAVLRKAYVRPTLGLRLVLAEPTLGGSSQKVLTPPRHAFNLSVKFAVPVLGLKMFNTRNRRVSLRPAAESMNCLVTSCLRRTYAGLRDAYARSTSIRRPSVGISQTQHRPNVNYLILGL